MRLDLQGDVSTWQEALEPWLRRAAAWLQRAFTDHTDREESVQEGMAVLCADAAAHWRPGEGLGLHMWYVKASVLRGQRVGGRGRGYSKRNRSVQARRFPLRFEDTLHGRELSPPQAAEWHELRAQLAGTLGTAADLIVGGTCFGHAADAVGIPRSSLRKTLRAALSTYQE